VLAEHITIGFVDYPAAAGHIQAGKLRAVAVGSRARIPELPDVPTIAESGFKGYEIEVWYALFAPAKTPSDVTSRVGGWFREAALSPAIRGKLTAQGFNPSGQCGPDFAAYLKSEDEKFGQAVRDANIRQQ
jgi:tripartite-type tricarboxylate transporter receptor subunit TctC